MEEALKRSTNPDQFKLRLAGVQFTSDETMQEMENSMTLSGGGDDMMSNNAMFDIERIGKYRLARGLAGRFLKTCFEKGGRAARPPRPFPAASSS